MTDEMTAGKEREQALMKALASMGIRLEASINLLSAVADLTVIPIQAETPEDAGGLVTGILVMKLNDVQACSLLLHDPTSDTLRLLAAHGQADMMGDAGGPYNRELHFRPNEGIAGRVFAENRARFWEKDSPGIELLKIDPGLSTPEALACLPVEAAGRKLGVLNVSFGSPIKFDTSMQRDLNLLSRVVANIILSFILKKELDEKAALLAKARDELEERVEARTAGLAAANEKLRREMAERQRLEEESARRISAHQPGEHT